MPFTGCSLLGRNIHKLETSQIVSHFNNGHKKSYSLVIFHSYICRLLVEVKLFCILWDPTSFIFTISYKTLITYPINEIVHTKVVFYCCSWILMKQIPIAGHASTDHFQQSTLKYVYFVWPCILPTLFFVVVELVEMHVCTYSEPSSIHTHNILLTLYRIRGLRESSANSKSRLTISTIWPKVIINYLILVRFFWHFFGVLTKAL